MISSGSSSHQHFEGNISSELGSSFVLSTHGVAFVLGTSEGSGSLVEVELGSPSLVSCGELGDEVTSSLLLGRKVDGESLVGDLSQSEGSNSDSSSSSGDSSASSDSSSASKPSIPPFFKDSSGSLESLIDSLDTCGVPSLGGSSSLGKSRSP